MYKFRDERINFCFEAYKQSTTGKFFLQHIISSFPIEAFVAIDNYNNYSLKSNNKKITVEFNKNRTLFVDNKKVSERFIYFFLFIK